MNLFKEAVMRILTHPFLTALVMVLIAIATESGSQDVLTHATVAALGAAAYAESR